MEDFLNKIRLGDKVWTGTSARPHARLRTVTRVTPTRIIVDRGGPGDRFFRRNGDLVGSRSISGHSIRGIASRSAIERFEKAQMERREQLAVAATQTEEPEELLRTLSRILPRGISVRACQHDPKKGFTFEICNLSEEEVRRVAAALLN